MKYFYDTEFLEGEQTLYQWGLKTDTWLRIFGIAIFCIAVFMKLTMDFSNLEFLLFILPAIFIYSLSMSSTPPTIDLISIGIVSEDGREYYAISKDFNLKEAWNRYDEKVEMYYGDLRNQYPEGRKTKVYWIRENVLKRIFNEWKMKTNGRIVRLGLPIPLNEMIFNYKNFKYCISKIGKSNKQISFEVLNFVHGYNGIGDWLGSTDEYYNSMIITEPKDKPIFYGYYSAYDHVVLCWLFGKMIDLPKGFPMYTIDLKQIYDEVVSKLTWEDLNKLIYPTAKHDVFAYLRQDGKSTIANCLKNSSIYPKETNAHNALADAKWNKELYQFIQTLK